MIHWESLAWPSRTLLAWSSSSGRYTPPDANLIYIVNQNSSPSMRCMIAGAWYPRVVLCPIYSVFWPTAELYSSFAWVCSLYFRSASFFSSSCRMLVSLVCQCLLIFSSFTSNLYLMRETYWSSIFHKNSLSSISSLFFTSILQFKFIVSGFLTCLLKWSDFEHIVRIYQYFTFLWINRKLRHLGEAVVEHSL